MADIKKIAMAAVGVGLISWLLGWLYKTYFKEGIANISFSAVEIPVKAQIQSGVDTTLAGKLLGYLGGVIPQGGMVMALVTLYVAALIIVWLGSYISERINLGKSENMKFALSMTLAAVLVGIVVGYMSPSIGSTGTAIAMLIYFGIISVIYSVARNIQGVRELPIFPAL